MASFIFKFNDVALNNLLYGTAGPVSKTVRRVAQDDVLAVARATLSTPWPGKPGPFLPPGPPYLRTGELREGLQVIDVPGPTGIESEVVSTAIHRGVSYGAVLKRRGYRFLPDSYYSYTTIA